MLGCTCRELEFWRVPVIWVAACCWSNITVALQDQQLAIDLHNKVWRKEPQKPKKRSMWRSKVWKILSEPRSSIASVVGRSGAGSVCQLLILLIFYLSVSFVGNGQSQISTSRVSL